MNDWDDIYGEEMDENLRKLDYALQEGHPNDKPLSKEEKRRNLELVAKIREKFEKFHREMEEANTVLERFGAAFNAHSFYKGMEELLEPKALNLLDRVMFEIFLDDE